MKNDKIILVILHAKSKLFFSCFIGRCKEKKVQNVHSKIKNRLLAPVFILQLFSMPTLLSIRPNG